MLTETIGYLAAICTALCFLPQLIRLWRERTAAGVSLAAFALNSAGTALWIAYGCLLGSWPIILANGIALCILLGVIAFKLRLG